MERLVCYQRSNGDCKPSRCFMTCVLHSAPAVCSCLQICWPSLPSWRYKTSGFRSSGCFRTQLESCHFGPWNGVSQRMAIDSLYCNVFGHWDWSSDRVQEPIILHETNCSDSSATCGPSTCFPKFQELGLTLEGTLEKWKTTRKHLNIGCVHSGLM